MIPSRLRNLGFTPEAWDALKAEALPASEAFIQKIMSVTAAHFNVSVKDILSASLNGEIPCARNMAIYLAYNLTLLSDDEVANQFSRKKAVVYSAQGATGSLIEKNSGVRKILFGILSELAGPGEYNPLNLPGDRKGTDKIIRDNKPFVILYGFQKRADADVNMEDERARALNPALNAQAILEKACPITHTENTIPDDSEKNSAATANTETPQTSLIIRVAAVVLKVTPEVVCGTHKASRANDIALYYARKIAKVPLKVLAKSRLSGGNKAEAIAEQVQEYDDLVQKDPSQLDKIKEIDRRVQLMVALAAKSDRSLDAIAVPVDFVATPTPREYTKAPPPRVTKQAETIDTGSELRGIDYAEKNLRALIDRLENRNIRTVDEMVPPMARFGFEAPQILAFFSGKNVVARGCSRKLGPTLIARAAAEVAGFENRSEPYTHLLVEPSAPPPAAPHMPVPKKRSAAAPRSQL